jgi:hypothetical protein
MSERLLKTFLKSEEFQAEHEGSIPFARTDEIAARFEQG